MRNWELQVQFKIHGKGKDLFGDGFAIWYAKERMRSGPVFGNNDFFQGLSVILDTYSNHNGAHNVRLNTVSQSICHTFYIYACISLFFYIFFFFLIHKRYIFDSINILISQLWLIMGLCIMITIVMVLIRN